MNPSDTMLPILFVVVAALLLLLLSSQQRRRRGAPAGPWPFYVRTVLSRPEQVLFHRLVAALPDHLVLAQVQVSRVLAVQRGVPFREWLNRIDRLSYDFVVCTRDGVAIAAIELDDGSHDGPRRRDADAKKDRASADAGLHLVRWHVRALPDAEAIRVAVRAPVRAAPRASRRPGRDPRARPAPPAAPGR